MENKYQQGKIYKIIDKTNNNIYIGSTIKTLNKRLIEHKTEYKKSINKKQSNTTSFEIIKNNNYEILLLETFPCNNKYELEQRERYYIDNNCCVNKTIPTRTKKEWTEKNKDKIKEQQKKWYENNKTKIKEKRKEYYENNKEKRKEYLENNKDKIKEYLKNKNKQKVICDLCGTQVIKNNLNRHKKTQRCKRLSICMIEDD